MIKLVLLPGMDGTGILFEPFLNYLPNDYVVQIISYPSHQKLSYQQLTDYVIERLPQKEDYLLLAESFAGPIAYNISLTHPKHLKQIIFVASFIRPPNGFIRLSRWLPLAKLIPKAIPDFIFRFLLGKNADKPLYRLIQKSLDKVSNEVLEFRIKEMRNLSHAQEYINYPCSYIQANNDVLVSKENSLYIKKKCQDFKLFELEGSHFILQVNPIGCVNLVKNIIESLDGLTGFK